MDGAAIEGGSIIVNVSRYTAIRWDFSFSSLDAAATLVKRYAFEDLSYAGSCSNAILGEWNSCKNTEPVLRLLGTDVEPGKFCSSNETEGGYAAVDGPFATAECQTRCENPLP